MKRDDIDSIELVNERGIHTRELIVEERTEAFIDCTTLSVAWDQEPTGIEVHLARGPRKGKLMKKRAFREEFVEVAGRGANSYFTMEEVTDGNKVKYVANEITDPDVESVSDTIRVIVRSSLRRSRYRWSFPLDIEIKITKAAADSLGAGDCVFSLIQTSTPDMLALHFLRDVPPSTRFYISDNGYENSSKSFSQATEGTMQFQVGASGVTAGTPVVYPSLNTSLGTWSSVSGRFELSTSGDTIYVYTQFSADTAPTFMCAASIGRKGRFSQPRDSNTGDCPTALGGNDDLTYCLEFGSSFSNAVLSVACVDGNVRERLNGNNAQAEYRTSNTAFFSDMSASTMVPSVKVSPDTCSS